jgi:hypothetical protein
MIFALSLELASETKASHLILCQSGRYQNSVKSRPTLTLQLVRSAVWYRWKGWHLLLWPTQGYSRPHPSPLPKGKPGAHATDSAHTSREIAREIGMISLGGFDNLDSESQARRYDGEECIIYRKHGLMKRQNDVQSLQKSSRTHRMQ